MMIIKLKQLYKDHFNLATVTFACAAAFLMPFYMAATGFTFTTTPLNVASPHQVILTDLSTANRTLAMQGNLLAYSDQQAVSALTFSLTQAPGAKPLHLDKSLQIDYRDAQQRAAGLAWSKRFQGSHDQDDWLEAGELVQLTVPLTGILKTNLGINTPFIIDITPPKGAILSIHRTTPAVLDKVIELE